MANVTFKGNPVTTAGSLPALGSKAPSFTLTKSDLSDSNLSDFTGSRIVMNIFLSLDTGTCANSVRKFNEKAGKLDNTVVLCISMDLPFAHNRFCVAEGLKDVITLSAFRSPEFGKSYGVTITSRPQAGLLARSVVIIDESGKVIYTEQVPEMSLEPDYDKALAALK
jgi:thioredoxin-dependent peroxiredoxin